MEEYVGEKATVNNDELIVKQYNNEQNETRSIKVNPIQMTQAINLLNGSQKIKINSEATINTTNDQISIK